MVDIQKVHGETAMKGSTGTRLRADHVLLAIVLPTMAPILPAFPNHRNAFPTAAMAPSPQGPGVRLHVSVQGERLFLVP